MDTEELKASLALLMHEMEHQDDDNHETYLKVRQILDSLKATGMPLPEDLVRLEEELEQRFAEDMKASDG